MEFLGGCGPLSTQNIAKTLGISEIFNRTTLIRLFCAWRTRSKETPIEREVIEGWIRCMYIKRILGFKLFAIENEREKFLTRSGLSAVAHHTYERYVASGRGWFEG